MRALLTTTLALAFTLMAAITYVAVTQDPLAGEPHAMVEVAPPDLAKLQPKVAPAPVANVPAPAAVEATSIAPAQPVNDLARAAENAGAPAQPLAAVKSAAASQPAQIVDDSVEGASVVMPQ